jgi:chromosome partitioning protein
MTTLALYNQKGGVGKTAATVNLAYLAAIEGYRTLLWDLDPQGAAGYYFQVESTVKNGGRKLLTNELNLADSLQESGYENLQVIPSDLSIRNADVLLNELKQGKRRLKSSLAALKNQFDIVIIDCPPGLSILHENIFAASDWVFMPNIPTTLSIRGFDTVIQFFRENGLEESKVKCFFSMVDHRKNLHHEVMAQYYRDKVFFKNYIPYLSDVEKMGQHMAPVESFAPSSYAAQCFRDLWKEMKKTWFS